MQDETQTSSFKVTPNANDVLAKGQESAQLISEIVAKKFKEEYAHDKATLFTIFGIFASIVTFISVEIQVLKTTCSFWKVTGLSLIILSSLLSFILVLDYIGRTWREAFKKQCELFPWHLLAIISVIFIIGITSSTFGNEQSCIENMIYTRYENNFNDRQLYLENLIQSQMGSLKNDIEKNSREIVSLKNSSIKN